MVTRSREPLMKAGWFETDIFSDGSDGLRICEGFVGVCGSFPFACIFSLVLLLLLTLTTGATGLETGDVLIDRVRAERLAVVGFVAVVVPFERSVLDRTRGMPVLLVGLACETSPLFAAMPLRAGIFKVLASSFEAGDPTGALSLRSTSRSFLHLEQRLGAGRGRGEDGGDKVS